MRQYCTDENHSNYLNIFRETLSICKKQSLFEAFIKLQYNCMFSCRDELSQKQAAN